MFRFAQLSQQWFLQVHGLSNQNSNQIYTPPLSDVFIKNWTDTKRNQIGNVEKNYMRSLLKYKGKNIEVKVTCKKQVIIWDRAQRAYIWVVNAYKDKSWALETEQ